MLLTIKHTLLIVVLIATLLMALVGGFMKIETSSHNAAFVHTSQIAFNCPAPPVEC